MRLRRVYNPSNGRLVAEYVNGECTFLDETFFHPVAEGPDIMPDIKPYKSMIDGSEISSRSKHREHLRQHNCVEVGNDSSLYRPPKPLESPPGLKEKIIRAVNEVEDRERRKKWH